MNPVRFLARSAAATVLAAALQGTHAQSPDPRLREVVYDPKAVVEVPVKRGVVTHILLGADEAIAEVGTGLGADCSKLDAVWCIAAQAGGRSIFVKPKSAAQAPNNLAVVTDKRTHSFRLVVLQDADPKPPLYRLVVRAPVIRTAVAAAPAISVEPVEPPVAAAPQVIEPSPADLIAAGRLRAGPQVVNSSYSIAEGAVSEDIVPSLVFDDGRFTYVRFPGNREVPAVFHVLGDGTETLVNARMEGDVLVVDRVSRQLMLRAGSAVVGVWNEAFDPEGLAPKHGTTAQGVERAVRADRNTSRLSHEPQGDRHE